MPIWTTPDGRYTFAMQTLGEGDGNSVVYDRGVPVWDRFSYEAGLGTAPLPPPSPSQPLPAPTPATPPGGPGVMRVIPVTDTDDGPLLNRMYPYWSNAVLLANTVVVFAGHADGHPRFFRVNMDGTVRRLGALLSYTGTGEGWYWNAAGEIYLLDGPLLRRVNPFTDVDRVVLDIRATHPGCDLWQAHSSDDGETHSATVRQITNEGVYPALGTVAWTRGEQRYYPAQQPLDESQVTPDGEFLIIKEGDDNRVVNLRTQEERVITNLEGAVGHSDCGPGYVVGEDDQLGACVKWDLHTWTRTTLFNTWNMGHVSVRGGRCLLSDGRYLSLVGLNGEGVTPLIEHGMVGSDYDHQVMANLDPTGRVACYVSNHGTDRFDVFLLVLS